jgi:SAM-dependent methyltransferase
MKNLDTYLSLCTEVYELSKPNVPQEDYAFYRYYVQKAQGPVLEPMCGTGRFLLPLLEEGFNVHGFDASHSMLARLDQKAKVKNLEPTVWYGFAEELNRPEKYDLIFIPSGSFCLITEEKDVQIALKVFYDHLTDSGVFLFEVETRKVVPELGRWNGSIWPKDDGTSILLSQLVTFDESVCKFLVKYECVDKNKITCTEVEEYKIKIYSQDELLAILKDAGFNQVRMLKAFDRNKQPTEDDESIVYECRK